MKLKNKSTVFYKGNVIDLCVNNSHTYNVESLAVHNSGGGSLVNYVLYITDLDPIQWNLPFSRFLSKYRCLDPKTLVLMHDKSIKTIKDLVVGDQILSADNKAQKVTNKFVSKHNVVMKITVNNEQFLCSENHKWFVLGEDGTLIQKEARELTTNDRLFINDNFRKSL